jgi:hypothetical protein
MPLSRLNSESLSLNVFKKYSIALLYLFWTQFLFVQKQMICAGANERFIFYLLQFVRNMGIFFLK